MQLGGDSYCLVASLPFRRSVDRSRDDAGEVPRDAVRRLGVAQFGELGDKRSVSDLREQLLEPARQQRLVQPRLERIRSPTPPSLSIARRSRQASRCPAAYPPPVAIDASKLRHGRVRGRYFRENFAQAGIDLVQIIPELVTNADAAIAAAGRERGRIQLRFGPADPDFLQAWQGRAAHASALPALRSWRHELVCSDDGEGVDADVVDQRLGALGVVPEREGQRGLFGRGLRDVWLAQGGGRIQGVRGERAVESWFFPAAGDEPYAYTHVLDAPAPRRAIRRELGIAREGTRVTVPLATGGCRRTRGCAGWCPTSCSCGRSSRTRAASCCSSCPASRSSSSATASRARPGAAAAVRRRDRASARRHRAGRRSPRRAADPAQPRPRRTPRRAGGPLRAGRARDDARRPRGPPRRPAPVRRGALRGDRAAAARGARHAAAAGRRARRPQRPQRGPPARAPACTRSSSGSCARSSTPRSGGRARVSSAPARRSPPATRSGCARSTTRSAPRSTRPGEPASRAAARPTEQPPLEEPREARDRPAADARRGPSARRRRRDALQAVAGAAASRRAAHRLAPLRPGTRPARHADRGRHRPRPVALALARRGTARRCRAAGRA